MILLRLWCIVERAMRLGMHGVVCGYEWRGSTSEKARKIKKIHIPNRLHPKLITKLTIDLEGIFV